MAIKYEYFNIGGLHATVLTVSLGVVSIISEVETKPAILVNAVEQILYQVKRQGRDRIVLG
ncbi:MAG: hypothetical protein PUP90_19655 [Nostoc sp. S4]|nr:hypothetical protein [Nostoc sp. S4]